MKKLKPIDEEMMYIELYGLREDLKDNIKTINMFLRKLPIPYEFKRGKK